MKSIIFYVLSAVFVLAVIGCGEEQKETVVGEDTMPPEVENVIVAGGTSTAATNGTIMIVFNEALDRTSVQAAVIFTPQADGRISYDEGTYTLTFDPEPDLQAHTSYSVMVSNVADKAGNVMEPFSFEISTSDKDVEPPKILETTPRNGEEEASNEARFNIEFDERIVQADFGQDFSLTPDPGVPVDKWLFTWSEDGKQVEIFIPLALGLEYEKEYILYIGRSSVTDLAGNKMEKFLQIEFTTGERPYEDINPESNTPLPSAWLYQVWKQGKTWHIIWGGNAPGGATKRGQGTISSENGEVTDVTTVMWEGSDQFDLRNGVLTFNGPVNGTGGRDGLEFKVKGKIVKFRLYNARPEWIFIGKDQEHPESTTFKLLNEEG